MNRPCVLLIKDKTGDTGLVSRMLLQAGYPPEALQVAGDLTKALQLLKSKPIEVILLELNLPDVQGREALDILTLHAPSVAVVVLTGTQDEEFGLRLVQAGAQGVLYKGSLSRPMLTFALRMALQQKKMEETLRESTAQVQALLENLDEAFFSVDVAGRRAPVIAKAMERICGRPLDHFRTNAYLWMDLVVPDQQGIMDSFRQHIEAGHPMAADFCIQRPDGEQRWVHAAIRPVSDELRKPMRVEGVLRDITLERLARESQRKLQRVDDQELFRAAFLSSAAHELATPLTPLKLEMLTLLRDTEGDAKLQPRLQLLSRNINRLAQLVTDLLDASRMQSGRLRHKIQPVEVQKVLAEVVQAFARQADEADVTLDLDARGEHCVMGDPLRLFQVVTNLVHNAIKFTPAGGTVHLELDAQGPDCLVKVADSGVGLTADELQSLFKPFSQARAGTFVGTGLGLFIAKGIVEHYGGSLACTSEGTGKGCCFVVRLPLAAPAALASAFRAATVAR